MTYKIISILWWIMGAAWLTLSLFQDMWWLQVIDLVLGTAHISIGWLFKELWT